ncbi:MAG: DUF2384 domain-containing protein [Luteitalea sp.]|nr:DUF2384 domain-containing protein [Luteitalea sp.]
MLENISEIVTVLGGEHTVGRRVRTTADLIRAIEEGLSPRAYRSVVAYLRSRLGVDLADLPYIVVPESTLKRRIRRKQRLTFDESEKLARLARIVSLAQDVWASPVLAARFLTEPHAMLEKRRPVEVAQTELGARQVEDLLYSLEYGLPV